MFSSRSRSSLPKSPIEPKPALLISMSISSSRFFVSSKSCDGRVGLLQIERHILRANAVRTAQLVAQRDQLVFRARHQQNVSSARGELAGKDFANARRCSSDEGGVHYDTEQDQFSSSKIEFDDVRVARLKFLEAFPRRRVVQVDARDGSRGAFEDDVLHLLNVDLFAP